MRSSPRQEGEEHSSRGSVQSPGRPPAPTSRAGGGVVGASDTRRRTDQTARHARLLCTGGAGGGGGVGGWGSGRGPSPLWPQSGCVPPLFKPPHAPWNVPPLTMRAAEGSQVGGGGARESLPPHNPPPSHFSPHTPPRWSPGREGGECRRTPVLLLPTNDRCRHGGRLPIGQYQADGGATVPTTRRRMSDRWQRERKLGERR